MRLFPLLAYLALTVSPAAQVTGRSPAVVLQAPTSQGCPVGLEARHADTGDLVTVGPSERHRGQAYLVSFLPQKDHSISQARITLHGLSGQAIIPAAGVRADPDAKESFSVLPTAAANHFFHSTVYTGKLTGVQWVEVNEMTYADGSKWHESGESTCRVAPNGLLLVAGAR